MDLIQPGISSEAVASFAPGGRCVAGELAEHLGEVGLVRKTELGRDFRDAECLIVEKLAGRFDAA